MRRRIVLATLAVGLLATGAACGDDDGGSDIIPQTGNRPTTTTTSTTTTAPSTTAAPDAAGQAPPGEDADATGQAPPAEEAAEEAGLAWTTIPPGGDPALAAEGAGSQAAVPAG